MAEVARVAVEHAAAHFDRLYSYRIPAGMQALPGCRVMIPFGAGNRTRLGIVLAVEPTPPDAAGLKELSGLVDAEPLLDAELLYLAQLLRDTTFCTYFDAVRAILPPGIGARLEYTYELAPKAVLPPDAGADERQIYDLLAGRGKPYPAERLEAALGLAATAPVLRRLCEGGTVIKSQQARRRVLDEKVVMVRLTEQFEEEYGRVPLRLTPKQEAVAELLAGAGEATVKELCYFAGVGRSVVERMERAGMVRTFTREVYRNPYAHVERQETAVPPTLSQEQQEACVKLCALADGGKAAAALLYGVTGSGKTEVFLRVIHHVLDGGRNAIVMVPEIALTPQTVARFHQHFGAEVAVLHSGLTMGERLDEWKRIRAGGARIVVGTRSAVFAPLARVGLIVMDEEQEGAYKSEKSPRYHARDIARARAAYHGGLLMLASATPSIESFYKARQGKYHLIPLRNRYGLAKLPDVTILDLALQPLEGEGSVLSGDLLTQLRATLERGEQAILLLNRRGYQTLIKCATCGAVASCPNCSVALTYHNANGQLMCHYCGYSAPADTSCPTCGSRFRRLAGAGTQKAEEELHRLLPEARVLRMDLDTTMARFSHEKHFTDFSDGKYDIIVGTQMVAKGLNFPNVTLVGILSADSALFAQDYRSYERAFSLFTQVVGRSGRAEKAGYAYIQTFSPENPILEMAARQDYDSFYAEEIENRQIHLYPPFCEMVGIGFSGVEAARVRAGAMRFLEEFTRLARAEYAELPLRVLGPCESQISRMAGRYRWRMAVKCTSGARTRALLRRTLEWFGAQKEHREVSVFIDPRFDAQ